MCKWEENICKQIEISYLITVLLSTPLNKLPSLFLKHENSTGHLCPECGESFRYKRKLRDHILVVHEGNEYECQFCKKTFNAKSSMQTHIRTIHEGRKPEPSKCSLCDRYFTTKAQVKVHILAVHEKKRPYACDLCNLSFAQTAHLKTHMKGKHRSAIWFFLSWNQFNWFKNVISTYLNYW